MPLYQYKCNSKECGCRFENLVVMSKRDEQKCPRCSKEAVRDGFQGFSVSTPFDLSTKDPYSAKEIDNVVGAGAAKKWEAFEKKKQKKLENAEKIITLDIKPGEKFNSEALLGNKERQEKSEMYSEAVTTHKELEKANGNDPGEWDKTGFKKIDL